MSWLSLLDPAGMDEEIENTHAFRRVDLFIKRPCASLAGKEVRFFNVNWIRGKEMGKV